MRRSLVLAGALASAAVGLCAPDAGAGATANENEPCASLVRTLESQIETIKQLQRPVTGLQPFSKRKIKDSSREHRLDRADEFAAPTSAADSRLAVARERQSADTLNGMLPGFGCQSLDIDAELKKASQKSK
jgi:hypothetical protein